MENVFEKLKALKGRPWTDTKNILNKFVKETCHVEEIVRTYRVNSETLPEKDREIYGLFLKNESFFLERCKQCSRLLKPSVINLHHDVHHKRNGNNGTTNKKFSFVSPCKKKISKKGSKSTSEDDSESVISSATSSPTVDLHEAQSSDSNTGTTRDDSIVDIISVEEIPSEDSKPPTPGPQDLYEEFAVPCSELQTAAAAFSLSNSETSKSKAISSKDSAKSHSTSLLEAHLLSNTRYRTSNCSGSVGDGGGGGGVSGLSNVDTKSKAKATFKLATSVLSKNHRENDGENEKLCSVMTEICDKESLVADRGDSVWRTPFSQHSGNTNLSSKTKTETKISIPISVLPQNVKIIGSLKKVNSAKSVALKVRPGCGEKITSVASSGSNDHRVVCGSQPSSPLSYDICAAASTTGGSDLSYELSCSEETSEKSPPRSSSLSSSSSKRSRKSSKIKNRSYRNTDFNPDRHCGVLVDENKHCLRSLTCKTHPISLRRAVEGRSKEFDKLLADHRASKEASKEQHDKNLQDLNLTEPVISIPILSVDKMCGNTIEIPSANNEAEMIKIRVPNIITHPEIIQKQQDSNTAPTLSAITTTCAASLDVATTTNSFTYISAIPVGTATTTTPAAVAGDAATAANNTAISTTITATTTTLTSTDTVTNTPLVTTTITNGLYTVPTVSSAHNITTPAGADAASASTGARRKENGKLLLPSSTSVVEMATAVATPSVTASSVPNSPPLIHSRLISANTNLTTTSPIDHQKKYVGVTSSLNNVNEELTAQLYDNDMKISFVCSDMLYKVGGLLYTDRSRQAIRKCMTPLIVQAGVRSKTVTGLPLHSRRKITDFLQLVKHNTVSPPIKLNLYKDENSENEVVVSKGCLSAGEMKLKNSEDEVERMKNVLTSSSKILGNLSTDENELHKLRLTRLKRSVTFEKVVDNSANGSCKKKIRRNYVTTEENHGGVDHLFSFDESSWSKGAAATSAGGRGGDDGGRGGVNVDLKLCVSDEDHFTGHTSRSMTERFPAAASSFEVPFACDMTTSVVTTLSTTMPLSHQSATLTAFLQQPSQCSNDHQNASMSRSNISERGTSSSFHAITSTAVENIPQVESYSRSDDIAAAATIQLLQSFQDLENQVSNSSPGLYPTQSVSVAAVTSTTITTTTTTTTSTDATITTTTITPYITTSCSPAAAISFENLSVNPYVSYMKDDNSCHSIMLTDVPTTTAFKGSNGNGRVNIDGESVDIAGGGNALLDGSIPNIEETISKNYSLLEEYCKNIATNELFLDDRSNYEYYGDGRAATVLTEGEDKSSEANTASTAATAAAAAAAVHLASIDTMTDTKLMENELFVVDEAVLAGVNSAHSDSNNLTPVGFSDRLSFDAQILTSYLSGTVCSDPNVATAASSVVATSGLTSATTPASTPAISATDTKDVNFVTDHFDVAQIGSQIPKQILTNKQVYDEILTLNKQFLDNPAVKTENPPTPSRPTTILETGDNESLNWLF